MKTLRFVIQYKHEGLNEWCNYESHQELKTARATFKILKANHKGVAFRIVEELLREIKV